MNKLSCMEIELVKGIGIGMVAGAAIGMLVVPKKRSKTSMIGKAVKAAGEVIDNAASVLGF